MELDTSLLQTAKESTNTGSSGDGSIDRGGSVDVSAAGESSRELSSCAASKRCRALSRHTSGKKTAEESTKTELSIVLHRALDVTAGRDHGVKTSRELSRGLAVDLAGDASIS